MKLYELTSQFMELQNMDAEPEILADTIEGIEGELEIKAENLLAVVKNIDSDIDQIDVEMKRLAGRKKTMKARQDWLREYLRSNMEAGGIDKISCPLFTITLRKAVPVLVIDDDSLIPEEFKTVVETVNIDKMAIKRAMKTEPIPGVSLVDGKRGLMIK